MWLHSVRRQLNGQPVGKGSLAGGGRTRDHDELLVSSLHDLLCNSGNSRLLDCLLHKKDLLYPLGNDLVIQLTYCGNFQLSAPLFRILLHLEDFLLGLEFRKHIRSLSIRQNQHKAFIIQLQVKIWHITGIVSHCPVKIVLKILYAVNIHPGNPAIAEQLLFIIHSVMMKKCNCFIRSYTSFLHRDFLLHQFCHPLLYLVKKCLIQLLFSRHGKVKTASYRIMKHHFIYFFFACKIINCL